MRRRKKEEGKLEVLWGMYLIFFLVILLMVQMQVNTFAVISSVTEDALAASNLASAVIDVREYGQTGRIKVIDPDTAYELYREALRENLDLDENWENGSPGMIAGTVEVEEYTIYEVKDRDVIIYTRGKEGIFRIYTQTQALGQIYTPDGKKVESAAIYSRISFPVKGIFGILQMTRKEKTVDIVDNKTGMDSF